MTPWYADAGEVCRIRESARVIVPLPGRLWSSGTFRKPHSALACCRLTSAHGPQVIVAAAARPPTDSGCTGSGCTDSGCTDSGCTDSAVRARAEAGAPAAAVLPVAVTPPRARHPAVATVTIRFMAGPLGAPCRW